MKKKLNPLTKGSITFVICLFIGVLSYDLFTSEYLPELVKTGNTDAFKEYTKIQVEFMAIIVSLVMLCILHWKEN